MPDLPPHTASSSSSGAERRLVTVLFADLVGSTEIATSVDPEEWRALIHAYFSEMVQPIQRYGGTVEKFIGDAIFAVFGVPRTHEDDAERAVRAAVGMQEGLTRLNPAFTRRLGAPLGLRIGIATGEVVALSDAEWSQLVVGEFTAMAERLERQAPTNGIVLSERTYRLVAPLVEAESLGSLALKGFPEAEQGFLVRGLRPDFGRPREIGVPLIGREEELADVLSSRDRLQEGRGQVVAIIGEAGLGKSRLVAELRGRLGTGIRFLEGRCHEFTQATAYGVVVQHLLEYLDFGEQDSREVGRVQLRTGLFRVFGSSPPEVKQALEHLLGLDTSREFEASVQGLAPDEVRNLVIRAIVTFWEAVAVRTPVLMMIEDLHWIDAASAAVLRELVPITERAPLMLLCTFRPERRSLAWEFKIAAERDYPHCYHELRLKPLSPDHTEQLAGLLLEGLGLPVELKRKVAQQAEGNPFYVEAVVRSLQEHRATAADVAHLPDTLQAVLQARLAGLPADTRRVLQAASVIGRTFSLRLLGAITGFNGVLATHLSALQRTDFVYEQQRMPEPRYTFKHVLLQQAAYHTLLHEERREFHRRVAGLLERESPDALNFPLLVHHFVHAEEWQSAFGSALKAGDGAQSLAALEAALGQYDIALGVARDHPESVTDRALLLHAQEARGHVLSFLSRHDEAEKHFEALLATYPEARIKARFHRHIGRVSSLTGDLRKAEASLNRALELLGADPDPQAEAATLRDLAHIMERRREFARALDYAQRSLAVALRHSLQAEVRDIYHVLAITHLFGGDLREASRYAAENLSLAVRDNDPLGIMRSRNDLAQVYLFTGNIKGARAEAEEALALATQLGIHMPLAQIRHTLAEIYLDQGRWEEAAGVLSSVEEILGRYALGAALEALVHREQGFVALARSQWDEALGRLETAKSLEEGTGIARHLPKIHRGLAEAYLGLRDLERAWDNAAKAKTYERGGNLFETPGAQKIQAVVARERGGVDEALALLEESRDLLEVRRVSGEYAKVLLELAITYAQAGRMKDAHETANKSRDICVMLEAPSLAESARRLEETLEAGSRWEGGRAWQ